MDVHQKDLFKVMNVDIEGCLEDQQRQNHNSEIVAIKHYSPEEVKRIRQKVNMSQRVFAQVMGSSIRTIKYWEDGHKKPSGAANRLLQLLDIDPDIMTDYGLLKEHL
ncbi:MULTISPECIES: DNA-binding transcriptional regulator [Listeria]|uniref:helix-turn-helix domain-containing protein n=1 Tax=Listeria TaxID=1637 RepID=UPI000B595063|nr:MULTISPECIES: type II toxin-antitoxin system MqsA family antitoxin [Listeria]